MIRKLLLSLAFILALTAPVCASDVTISGSVLPGFNPAGIGNDKTISVTVTSGSPTVTSSALFPPNTVGIGGFRVKIGSTAYTVASIDSTSSLTLTTNYASSSGSATMVFYKWVEWRFYANQAFTPRGASYVVQPGAPGSGSWFRRYAASVVTENGGSSLYLPEITIPATTDATDNNTAKWTIGIYQPSGAPLQFFLCSSNISQLAIPPTTPTTYQALCAFNAPGVNIPAGTQAYNKAEIDARFPACTTGQMIYYAASGNKQACLTVGSGLQVAGGTISALGGISSLNGLTGSTQTFATGTSGSDFGISSSGSAHTFNLPTASASNRGLLSSADWTTFNNKLGSAITSLNGLTGSTQTFATGTSGSDFGISSSGSAHTFNLPTASASNRGLLSSTDWTTFNNKSSPPPFNDQASALVKGSSDATKLLRFEVDGFTTGTTRVLTPQDTNYIIAGTNISNSFSANQAILGTLTYRGTLAVFSANANEPPASNFATLDTRNAHVVLNFDDSTNESAVFSGMLRSEYTGNGITLTIVWAAATATSGNVVWNAAFERIDDGGQTITGDSFAAARTATCAAPGSSGVTNYCVITFSSVQIDGLLTGEAFRLKVTRNASSGSDTMVGDAQLLRVFLNETP